MIRFKFTIGGREKTFEISWFAILMGVTLISEISRRRYNKRMLEMYERVYGTVNR